MEMTEAMNIMAKTMTNAVPQLGEFGKTQIADMMNPRIDVNMNELLNGAIFVAIIHLF